MARPPPGESRCPAAIGSVPLAASGGTVKAGTITWALAPDTAPEWILPVVPVAKLEFNYVYNSSPALIGSQAADFVSKAKQAGITILLQGSNFNSMISNYTHPYAPANENRWAMADFGGYTDEPYATTFGLFNTGGTNQVGDYSNPMADALINASMSGADPAAVRAEAAFLTADQLVQFHPNPDHIWAWKSTLSAQYPQAFQNLTQYYATPEFWYFTR